MIAVSFVISDGFCLRFFDDDRAGHLRMNGTKIAIYAGSARCDGEFVVGVERSGFLKLLLNADYRVRFLVPVNPGYFFPGLYRQSFGSEVEILNHDLVLFDAVSCSFLLGLAEGKMSQEQKAASK